MDPASFDRLDLDRLRIRRGAKWNRFGDDVIPAWVADMDFPAPPEVHEVLAETLTLNDLGYASDDDQQRFVHALAGWSERRHGWRPDTESVRPIADVMQGVAWALSALTDPGDGVIVQTPAYTPFFTFIEQSGRRLVSNPLHPEGSLDLDRLRDSIDPGVRALLVCNPHNPTGHCLTRQEIDATLALAEHHDLALVVDEIWADVILPGNTHHSFAALTGPAERAVVLTSASKTFGLPGLSAAAAIVADPDQRSRLAAIPRALLGHPSALGLRAMAAAWDHGDSWVDHLVGYLADNHRLAQQRLVDELPGVRVTNAQATYLLWVDCRALDLPEDPAVIALRRGRVAVGRGPDYGPEGVGHLRLNLATSRSMVTTICDRLISSLLTSAEGSRPVP